MMRELSDNILDIAQNSISAGASLVEIDITVSHTDNAVSLAFIDDGCGKIGDLIKAVMRRQITAAGLYGLMHGLLHR